MRRPPFDRRRSTVCVLVIVVASIISLTGVQAAPGQSTTVSVDADCEDYSYPPLPLESPWEETYTDTIDNDSEQDWSGGEIVQVSADGECSLLVTDGESETLEAATINGTSGAVTGTVDLGSNGRVRLTANTSESGGPTNGTNELVLSNPGPDYGDTVVIEVGDRSEEVSLSTGRFFQFAIQQDNGTAQIAVWNVEDNWDGEWDVQTETVTSERDWRLTLDGRAFLDGIAVGVKETNETTRTTSDTAPTTTEDERPGPEYDPDFDSRDPDFRNTNTGQEESTPARIFFGALLIGVGALGVRYARPLTRFGEQIDAIGSKTPPSEVEAAAWNVALTKIIAAGFALFGLYLVGKAVL